MKDYILLLIIDEIFFLKLHFDMQTKHTNTISLIIGNLYSADLITGISSIKKLNELIKY